jgi:FkbM family methyltransferase
LYCIIIESLWCNISFRLLELAVTEVFRKSIKKGMTIIDVGANVGYYSLMAAKIAKNGEIYAFEPETDNFSLLNASIKQNNFKNLTTMQECVSDIDGTTTFFINTASNNLGSHSMIRSENGAEVNVKTTRLDTFIQAAKIDKVDVLKIDAESAEPLVLLGAKRLLETNSELIVLLEYTPEAWVNHQSLLASLFEQFYVYEIVDSPFLLRKIKQTSLSDRIINLYLKKRNNPATVQ